MGFQAQKMLWVCFVNDKPDATFYLSNPLQMLSQKRETEEQSQGISLNESDVPISQNYIDQVVVHLAELLF